MLILNFINNGLACDCGVCRVLIMTYHLFSINIFLKNGLFYLMYYIWYTAFMGSYYFLCVKKNIEQIYQNRCLFIRRLFVMAFSSVQNILRILQLTLKMRQKCNFQSLPSNQECSKQLG